ncbi:MAG: lactate utilization protein [Planctomycetaceae bacterium]|jgi:L-lactate dehydrogenase complex protein LldG|nr:lactate utilization protein [Planctomycetaceae bacterium]
MTTQESILTQIRTAIADQKTLPPEIPVIPKVWEIQEHSPAVMTENFRANLETVQGEFVLCSDFLQAVQQINDFLNTAGLNQLAVLDRPLSRKTAEQLDKLQKRNFVFAPSNPAEVTAVGLAELDAGLVSPEYLLADTGSCLFTAPTAFDRLATYLMPISVVVAEISMLRENLPAVWVEMKPKLETATTGEFVIVTGPSRTADIEKILILGVHGPKRFRVFLFP